MFIIVALFSVAKKGLEIHYDTAKERVANGSWAFVGAITAKILEYLAYAARFELASKAWNFWLGEAGGRRTTWLSVEQLARRHLWARDFFKQHLLRNYQEMASIAVAVM